MNLKLIKQFPGWVYDLVLHPENYATVMSDDYDSYLSCRYLRKHLNIPIYGFYDFQEGLYLSENRQARELIFIDVACIQNGICCFDNHYQTENNHMCANPNMLVDVKTRSVFNQKYNASTLFLLYALFGSGNANFTEKMTLMTVDSFYSGFFNQDGRYRHINERWLDVLNMRGLLQEIINTHEREDYSRFKAEMGFDRKFMIEKNHRIYEYAGSKSNPTEKKLLDDNRLVFPNSVMEVQEKTCSSDEIHQKLLGKGSKPREIIFSAAQTYQGTCQYSVIISDSKDWRHNDEQENCSAA